MSPSGTVVPAVALEDLDVGLALVARGKLWMAARDLSLQRHVRLGLRGRRTEAG